MQKRYNTATQTYLRRTTTKINKWGNKYCSAWDLKKGKPITRKECCCSKGQRFCSNKEQHHHHGGGRIVGSKYFPKKSPCKIFPSQHNNTSHRRTALCRWMQRAGHMNAGCYKWTIEVYFICVTMTNTNVVVINITPAVVLPKPSLFAWESHNKRIHNPFLISQTKALNLGSRKKLQLVKRIFLADVEPGIHIKF